MKLTKIKALTVASGLLTLSSLIMLFFGLCNQVNKSSYLLEDGKTISLSSSNGIWISASVVAVMIFGFAFFAGWLKSGPAKAHLIRHKV